jgi:hypothetical protein
VVPILRTLTATDTTAAEYPPAGAPTCTETPRCDARLLRHPPL